MQAEKKSTLSSEQRHTLEGTYTALVGITTYLEAHRPYVVPEDQAAIENLISFAVLNLSRLVEHFPEVRAWEEKGRQS